jgi:hypothetical protein
MPVPAKKRMGIAGYVSPQPQVPVTKRKKSAADLAALERALKKLPASKRTTRVEAHTS